MAYTYRVKITKQAQEQMIEFQMSSKRGVYGFFHYTPLFLYIAQRYISKYDRIIKMIFRSHMRSV